MELSVKFSSIFFLVAALSISTIILFMAVDYYGTRNLYISYCINNGFKYEDRLFNGAWRGYCMFEDVNCYRNKCFVDGTCLQGFNESDVAYTISECPASDYYQGECTPCMYEVTSCGDYENVKVCNQTVTPVCARIRVGLVEPFTIHEQTVGNACTACINSKNTEFVTHFTNRSCETKPY